MREKLPKRYSLGLTDYRHRARMLTNYEQIYRVVFGKKGRYSYSGVYITLNPLQPDLCLYYADTRHLTGTRVQKEVKLGEQIRHYLASWEGASYRRMALDRGRRKHLLTTSFERGLRAQ